MNHCSLSAAWTTIYINPFLAIKKSAFHFISESRSRVRSG